MRRIFAAALFCALATTAAVAQTAAPAASALWSPGDLYIWLAAHVLVPVIGGMVAYGLTKIAAVLQKQFHFQIDADLLASIEKAAMDGAGRIFASQDATFAGMKIDVRSQLVADEVPKVMTAAEAAIDKLGITPDTVANLIAAKVGQLQAMAPALAPVVVANTVAAK